MKLDLDAEDAVNSRYFSTGEGSPSAAPQLIAHVPGPGVLLAFAIDELHEPSTVADNLQSYLLQCEAVALSVSASACVWRSHAMPS